MKKNYRAAILLLVMAMVTTGALFAGAGREDDSSSTAEGFAGQTMRFLTIQPHNVASTQLAGWFEEETGSEVELIVVPYDNVIEKAVLDVTSGANEVHVVDYWYPGLGALVENGVLENLDDWYEENAAVLNVSDYLETFFDPYTMIDGSRYGIPFDGDMHLLWYSKPLFEKHDLTPPTTWDEYLEVSRTITENEAGNNVFGSVIMGAKIPLILIGTYLNRLGSFGGDFFDAAGNPTVNSPQAVAALDALIEQQEYALPTPSGVAFDEGLGAWTTGNAGMMEFWTDLGAITDDPENSAMVDQWGVVPLPAGPAPNGRVVASVNAGFGMGVSAGSDNMDLSFAFLEFVARPSTSTRVASLTGGIDPVRQSTLEDSGYIDFVSPAVADAIAKAHANAITWPTSAEWFDLQEPLNDNLSLALTGAKSAREALDDTQEAWLEIMGR